MTPKSTSGEGHFYRKLSGLHTNEWRDNFPFLRLQISFNNMSASGHYDYILLSSSKLRYLRMCSRLSVQIGRELVAHILCLLLIHLVNDPTLTLLNGKGVILRGRNAINRCVLLMYVRDISALKTDHGTDQCSADPMLLLGVSRLRRCVYIYACLARN